ncbi:MAG TPA: hypothetical protein VF832_12145 [Longimicrobiales bacterium]
MAERKRQVEMVDVLDRVSRGLIVDSALPVSPVLDELRRVEESGQRVAEPASGDENNPGRLAEPLQ